MDESLRMVAIALTKVSEEQLWKKPNPALNSIGNLILHLCGNMTQYGIASLKDITDKRERNLEFSVDGGFNKMELLEKLTTTVNLVKRAFEEVTTSRLLTKKQVQGFEF